MTIETKYDIGDTVFYMDDNKVKSNKIDTITIERTTPKSIKGSVCSNYIRYCGVGKFIKEEEEVFATKEELLKSL